MLARHKSKLERLDYVSKASRLALFSDAASSASRDGLAYVSNYSTEKMPNDIGSISKYPSRNTAPCTRS
jgi:hypothetical protein